MQGVHSSCTVIQGAKNLENNHFLIRGVGSNPNEKRMKTVGLSGMLRARAACDARGSPSLQFSSKISPLNWIHCSTSSIIYVEN